MLFPELPFTERFDAARAFNFSTVEFLFPYSYDISELRDKIRSLSLEVALIDFPPGDWKAGDRGLLSDPARRQEFRESVKDALRWADALSVRQLNCLTGLRLPELAYELQWQTCVENLRFAAPLLAERGMRLLLEPINHYDFPGYFLDSLEETVRMMHDAGQNNIFLQFDVYHIHRIYGEVTERLLQHLPLISHIQVADSPGRNEPGTGKIEFDRIFDRLDRAGYTGYIGMEYVPSMETEKTFAWFSDYGHLT